MFEDIYNNESEERVALDKCPHLWDQKKCEFYDTSDHPKWEVCKHLGKLTSYCYKDVARD
jgi:hypothetical protein